MNWYKKAQTKSVVKKHKTTIKNVFDIFLRELKNSSKLWQLLIKRMKGIKIDKESMEFAEKETKRIFLNVIKSSFLAGLIMLPAGIAIAYLFSKLLKKYVGIEIMPNLIQEGVAENEQ